MIDCGYELGRYGRKKVDSETLLRRLQRHDAIAKEVAPLVFHKKELKNRAPSTTEVFDRLLEWAETCEKIGAILNKHKEQTN